MAIVNDRENERVVDTETGEYMTWRAEDRENFASYYVLHDKTGKGLLGSVVRSVATGDPSSGGAANHVKYVFITVTALR